MPRRKKDKIWKHYQSFANKSAKCCYCGKEYKIANVNKMEAHLEKCFKCPLVVRTGLRNKENCPPSPISQPDRTPNSLSTDSIEGQPDVNMCCTESPEFTEEKQQNLTKLLSKAIFVTGTPLSMVEHPLWKDFFHQLQPLFRLPTRKAVSTLHLDAIHKEMEKEITEELKSTNYLHLQCDGWSNQRNEGIINFIIAKPEPFFVKSLHTGSHRHTGEYLREEIENVMRSYGSDKFVTLIGDNAKNVQKAFELVKTRNPHVTGLSCAAHTLNLLCHDFMKSEAIAAFLLIAVESIKTVKRSQILSALLAQIIKEKGSGEQLKLPCKTRWGSYLFAFRSLLKNKSALQCLAVHEEALMIPRETKANFLDETFWKMVEECTALLEPITQHIFKLESNDAHISDVYMTFKDIKSKLLFILPDLTTLIDNNVRERLLNAVEMRKNNCIKPIHLAAYMLDPKTQGIELDEEEELKAMAFINVVGAHLHIEVMADLANYRAKEGFWGKSCVWSHVENIDAAVWWKGICKSKSLSKVAVRLLTAPCTSAATERSFSTHGNIHTAKRNRLTTERAGKIAFISYNWNLLHKSEVPLDDDEVEDMMSSPLARSELSSPTLTDPQPSTSRGPEPIEFCNINAYSLETDDSDSENDNSNVS